MEPVVYLITGPMAAGKSTVARLLASRFSRGVHLEGDLFRRSIVTGREEVTPDLQPEAMEQLRLRYRLAAAAADTYVEAGFTVALEDVVAGPLLGDYRTMIRSRPCHVVVLLPSAEALAAREAGRATKGDGAWTVEALRDGFTASTPRIGIWLDTTAMTPDETVAEILALTTSRTLLGGLAAHPPEGVRPLLAGRRACWVSRRCRTGRLRSARALARNPCAPGP